MKSRVDMRFSINKYAYFYNYIKNNEKYEETYLNLIRNEIG